MSKQQWSHAEVLRRIRQLHEQGCELSACNALAVAPRVASAAVRYFGNWRSAVMEAGIDYSAIVKASRQRENDRRTKWSKELIMQRIGELVEKNEPMQSSVARRKYPELYGSACSPRYFGGWASALEAAGVHVVPGRVGRPTEHKVLLIKWRVELLLERIRQIAVSIQTLDERHISIVAPELHAATVRQLGSWAEVVRAVESVDGLEDADPSSARV